jgi:hypothetical protein
MSTNLSLTIKKQFAILSEQEREKLLKELSQLVHNKKESGKRDIFDLRGLGKEIWEGIDAQKYVDEERASWIG